MMISGCKSLGAQSLDSFLRYEGAFSTFVHGPSLSLSVENSIICKIPEELEDINPAFIML
jgi:hypothetical protein